MENETQPTPIPPAPQQPSVPPTPTPSPAPVVPDVTVENQVQPKKFPWLSIGIGIAVFVIVTGAAAYFGGFLNPTTTITTNTPISGNQGLNGSAIENTQQTQSGNFIEQLGGTEETTADSQQNFTSITQTVQNACPQGEVMNPVSSRCACDINNNYFEVNIPGAYAQPTAGIASVACSTCAQISDQILQLGQSNDPLDATRKTQLQAIAEQNNCTPCAVYDDRINEASQNQQWDKFFQLVVQKSNDKTCGRTLPVCDSAKWQLLFLNQLRDRAGKDPQTTPAMLQSLQDLQQSMTEDLGNNIACYNMQNLCDELKSSYGNVPQAISTQQSIAAPVGSTPLLGQNPTSSQQTQEGQSEQLVTSTPQFYSSSQQIPKINTAVNLQDESQIDFSSVTPTQLFDKQYYLLHCPVEEPQEPEHPPVKRIKDPTPV